MTNIFTGRNEVVAKVMFLQVCVCPQGVRGEGVCLSACWDAIPPRMETTLLDREPPPHPGLRPPPPGWRTPQMENPPLDGEPPRWRTPPGWRTPPRWRTPPDGEPPPGSRLQHTVYERPVRILLECILVCY